MPHNNRYPLSVRDRSIGIARDKRIQPFAQDLTEFQGSAVEVAVHAQFLGAEVNTRAWSPRGSKITFDEAITKY
ncbi:hypothetical protein B9Q04_07420 [Candidatus Marsarchaeota G2 archaeon BE_D]|jgi:hypothetical protein|uniref:Uncharacterized protein n=1 Tax=Candidatus Marsarchaeota G2 archaeon BE_D TaxID=1978158 RepID=A0A2R6CB25_9ARCH|nr:MAG: hypothetical protein B9Q04_07420 [Candidatus Marsarchaeota G2 archaeon BE_D]